MLPAWCRHIRLRIFSAMDDMFSTMFIVFGFRTRPSKVSEGDFFCPKCGADRHYILQRFRQWFTLFFLPIFPMSGSKGEQVKCQTCNTAYRPEVLQTPTSAVLTDSIRDTMRMAAVAMLHAGNAWDVSARQAAVDTITSTGATGYNDANLSQDLNGQDTSQLPAQLGHLVRGLNDQGREMFISRLAQIAAADGTVSESERSVLDMVGSALGLSAAHVLGILTSVVNAPRPY
jgi:tellurite resistance protein